MQKPSVSLVIPCFNEVERVSLMMHGIQQFIEHWNGEFEILVINDGSNDGCDILIQNHPIAKKLTDKFKIINQENLGKGAALKNGVEQAKHDFILTIDADMATSPLELISWFESSNGFNSTQIWIASRELKDSRIQEVPYRKLIGNIFNFFIRKITGLQFHDTQCGFKLYPQVIAKELFRDLQIVGWSHDVEILLRAKIKGIVILEKPITWNAVAGSKIRVVQDSWNMFFELLRIRKMRNKL